MGSWAHVAGLDAPPRQAARTPDSDNSTKSTAVVDTNAIVAGLQLHALAERIVTTADVLTEVRDARSREFLASLPFGLETLEPAPQSLAAVARFARATGDLQSLSDVDLRVLALTHTLEVQAIGSAHLRELPAQQAVQKKAVHANQGLPGWGDTGSTWAQLDKLNDEEEAKHGNDFYLMLCISCLLSLSQQVTCSDRSSAMMSSSISLHLVNIMPFALLSLICCPHALNNKCQLNYRRNRHCQWRSRIISGGLNRQCCRDKANCW